MTSNFWISFQLIILSLAFSLWAPINSPFQIDAFCRRHIVRAAIQLILPLPAAANSNEQITHLTAIYLRQCTWDTSFKATRWSHLHPVSRGKREGKGKERGGIGWVLEEPEWEEKRGRREPKRDPSLKGSVSFTAIPLLQCAVMWWCIAPHGPAEAFIFSLLHVSRYVRAN